MGDTAELVGFAYGEDREEGSGRSLGYRLLTGQIPGTNEIESLARWLQAAPYPEAWPAVDLFCSVLLADGRRAIARARYGLVDHTASQRRGGLELLGVIAPAGIGIPAALAVYRWLGQRRAETEDAHQLGGVHQLADVLALARRNCRRPDGLPGPVPVLPVRLWQDGAFLFAATAPADPDHHLRLLDLASASSWQWLPLVGPDFPLPTYAQRGPLIAWTAHLAGVAVRLDRTSPTAVRPEGRSGPVARWVAASLALAIVGLLGANLWTIRSLRREVASLEVAPRPEPPAKKPIVSVAEPAGDRERFARALYQLLLDRSDGEVRTDRAALLERYEGLIRRYPDLAVANDNEEGKLAIATASLLAARNPRRIDQSIKQALEGKGFSDRVIQAAREHVREQLSAETKAP